jgi:predicted transcriptional regulator
MIKETLKSLGLTQNEVEIYLTLLNAPELSVNEIGSRSGLHRQVCYDALDRLLEKGFVSFISKDHKKFFKALDPEKIITYLDNKKDEINSILPQLQGIYVQKQEDTDVELIKGKMVVRTILNDIVKTLKEQGGEMLATGIEEAKFVEFDEIAIKQYINRMKKGKFKEKLLARETAEIFYEGSQSEYRLLPEELFNPNPAHIYGDKIATIVWGNPVFGIIIKSKQLADANRKHFEILWNMAKKRK